MTQLVPLASLSLLVAGCVAPRGATTTDLHGGPIAIEMVAIESSDEAVTARLLVDGRPVTVATAGGRLTITEQDRTFALSAAGDRLSVEVDGAGESFRGERDRVNGEAVPWERAEADLRDSGALVDSDRERFDTLLPVALWTTHEWTRLGPGPAAERAEELVVAWAHALANAPREEDAPSGSLQPAGIKFVTTGPPRNGGGSSCTASSQSCRCSVTCGASSNATCTTNPTCSCSCVSGGQ